MQTADHGDGEGLSEATRPRLDTATSTTFAFTAHARDAGSEDLSIEKASKYPLSRASDAVN